MHLAPRPLGEFLPTSPDPFISNPLLGVMEDPNVGFVAARHIAHTSVPRSPPHAKSRPAIHWAGDRAGQIRLPVA